jgi:hypothetical protein
MNQRVKVNKEEAATADAAPEVLLRTFFWEL